MRMTTPGLTRSGNVRIAALDRLRGLMIVLMVLDHVRDFFHRTALTTDPLSMDSGAPALFATRWITHLCAPAFILLAGVSIWLQQANGKHVPDLSRFLLVRGMVFVALEVTVIGLGFNFAPWLFFQVIWALGVGMMMLAALVWLPRKAIAAIAVVVTLASPLLMLVPPGSFGVLQPLFGFGPMAAGPVPVLVAYPALPWFGLLLIGYLAGPFVHAAVDVPRRLLVVAAVGIAAFALLRAFNPYGLDYRPWRIQPEGLWTMLSFIDVAKYPPSLLFLLLTASLASAMLAALACVRAGFIDHVLSTLGRTAMFTYLLHIWLAHGLALAVGVARGVPAAAFVGHITDPSRLVAVGWGFSLPLTYAAWMLVLAMLWPLAAWHDRRKQASRHPLYSYL